MPRITKKGQVTIPKKIREAMGIKGLSLFSDLLK